MNDVVYIAHLEERFGGDITAVDLTEAKAKRAVLKLYREMFINVNGFLDKDYYKTAREDVWTEEMELGKPEFR